MDLRNTVNSLQDEISQLRKILEEKCVYADAFVPPMPQIDGHQIKTQFRMSGVRARGWDRGRSWEQDRKKEEVGVVWVVIEVVVIKEMVGNLLMV